ncbi:hypothetical protein FACS1894216_00950 [Synergistales bacterium]|nr:hypothetical protein FACS1894216_00950 [Synergistales bacterium]
MIKEIRYCGDCPLWIPRNPAATIGFCGHTEHPGETRIPRAYLERVKDCEVKEEGREA